MSRRDEDLAREIRTHLELDAEDRMADGLSESEARRQAHVAFGGVARTRESARAVWVSPVAEAWWRDLVYSCRVLIASPLFTLVTVATLSLGIGANTAIFSLIDQVLLRNLPVRDPERLVMLENPGIFQGFTNREEAFSAPMFRALHASSDSVLDGLAARFTVAVTASVGAQAERAVAEVVSGDYFKVFSVAPAIGRLLGPSDDLVVDGHPVVVLTHSYWARRFGRNPAAVGTPLTVNGVAMTIVGVASQPFAGADLAAPADIFVPLMMKRGLTPTRDDLASWRARWVTLTGRLKPGGSIESTLAALQPVYRQWLLEDVKTARLDSGEYQQYVSKSLVVRDGARGLSALRLQFSTVLVALMGMVGLVLLIACANVASLLLARAASRQRDAAIRLALGAGRGRVMRQRLIEVLLLTLSGALVGLAVAALTMRALIDRLPFPGARLLTAQPDPRVMLFALFASAFTAVIAGLWPAWQSATPSLLTALKDETASVLGGGRQARVRRSVVVAQVGLSVILLAGAGLFARSLYGLRSLVSVDGGQILQFRIDLASTGYSTERARSFIGQLEERLNQVPGVKSASAATVAVFNNLNPRQTIRVQGYQNSPGENMNPSTFAVGPGYFSTMSIPLLVGRDFTAADASLDHKVAIVNETMARYFWKDQNPIGRRFGRPGAAAATEWEVIGIVADRALFSMREPAGRAFFSHYLQSDTLASAVFYARYQGRLDDVAGAARRVVSSLDAGVPVYEMRSVAVQLDQALINERLLASLSLVFAGLATVLAAVGMYGLMSFTVARRTRELGIRIALGASRHTVMSLVLGDVARLIAVGAACGLPLAIGLGRLLEAQLFGISPTDVATLAMALVSIVVVGLVSSYVPARRATKVSPLTALRYE